MVKCLKGMSFSISQAVIFMASANTACADPACLPLVLRRDLRVCIPCFYTFRFRKDP